MTKKTYICPVACSFDIEGEQMIASSFQIEVDSHQEVDAAESFTLHKSSDSYWEDNKWD